MNVFGHLTLSAALLSLAGCATIPKESAAQVVIAVQTEAIINRIEFRTEDGFPFTVAGVPEGTTVFRYYLQPGSYCLAEYVMGGIDAGRVFQTRTPVCLTLVTGNVAMLRLSFSAQGDVASDRDDTAVQAALDDPTVQKIVGYAGVKR
ncbi:MAG: hypothetical protein JKY37_13150 [Nannocystaceae bacterium]|nr:hypothetical protein [Nannocystaceae bacterium]